MKLSLIVFVAVLASFVHAQSRKKLDLGTSYSFEATSLVDSRTTLNVWALGGRVLKIYNYTGPDGNMRTIETDVAFPNGTLYTMKGEECVKGRNFPEHHIYFPKNATLNGVLCNGDQGRIWKWTNRKSHDFEVCTGKADKIPFSLKVSWNGKTIMAWQFTKFSTVRPSRDLFKIPQQCYKPKPVEAVEAFES